MLTILALALVPQTPKLVPTTGWDKANPLLAFVFLALLGRWAYRKYWWRVLAGLMAFGALIEVLQLWMPPRMGEWGDLLADALGLGAAALIVSVLNRFPRRSNS